MTHFTVLVTGDDVAEQLAPHDVSAGGDKWDWWLVGGRWTGYFPVVDGFDADDEVAAGRLVVGEPGAFGDRPSTTGRVDGGQRWLLDLDRMRLEAGEEAARDWDRVHEVVGDTPEPTVWSEYVRRLHAGELSIEAARDQYWSQPRVAAFSARGNEAFRRTRPGATLTEADEQLELDRRAFLWRDPDEYWVRRDLYLARVIAAAVPGYALLHEGRWIAPGEIGLFSTSTDDESSRAGYYEHVNGLIDSLPDTTMLTVVDCHV